MIQVATYQAYIDQSSDGNPQFLGDAASGTIQVQDPGPAVIDIIALGPYTFAGTPVTFATPNLLCGFGKVSPNASGSTQEIVINVANGSPGSVDATINLVDPAPASITLTIVTSLF